MHKAVAIIPARFHSTRFPGKPLATLKGKIVVQHVYEHVSAAKHINAVFVATDDQRIFEAVTSFGGKAIMTSPLHTSGSDRIAEAAEGIDCDYIINVQGDEPFIRPEMIDDVTELLYNDDRVSISTLAKRITDIHEIMSPGVVKVVMNNEGFALYFSRAPIPYYRDAWLMENTESRTQSRDSSAPLSFIKGKSDIYHFGLRISGPDVQNAIWYKHIGIYGYRKNTLRTFSSLEESRLEQVEKLEQLRALEAGMRIKVKITEHDTFGIDTLDDLRKAEEWQNISL